MMHAEMNTQNESKNEKHTNASKCFGNWEWFIEKIPAQNVEKKHIKNRRLNVANSG